MDGLILIGLIVCFFFFFLVSFSLIWPYGVRRMARNNNLMLWVVVVMVGMVVLNIGPFSDSSSVSVNDQDTTLNDIIFGSNINETEEVEKTENIKWDTQGKTLYAQEGQDLVIYSCTQPWNITTCDPVIEQTPIAEIETPDYNLEDVDLSLDILEI